MKKRGQGDIAALVLLLGLFILLFMLFVPIDVREELLPGSSETSSRGDSRDFVLNGGEKTLLNVIPGKVTPFKKRIITKDINPISIFSRLEKDSIELSNKLVLNRNIFTENFEEFEFNLDNSDNVEGLSLFFFILENEGRLKVELNNILVFDDEVSTEEVPIKLPVGNLRDRNRIKILVNRGIIGGYSLNDVQLKTDTRENNKLVERNIFLTKTEKSNLEDVNLQFFNNCLSLKTQGTLVVAINNNIVFNDILFCDSTQFTLEISPSKLRSGDNLISFRLNKGDYQLDDIELDLELSEIDFPKYNFEIANDEFEDIEDGFLDAVLRLEFKDKRTSKGRKRAKISVNEESLSFDTIESSFERNISSLILRGSNIVKLVPRNEFEVDSLIVFLDEDIKDRFNLSRRDRDRNRRR
tara:strand:+ start:10223 stop:11458 length:1236 start_codon:yes stop_codon:yes gene_type:complete